MATTVANITIESDATPSVDLTSGADSASVSSGSNASANGGDEFFFGKFCRHVPRVLRHQVISKLVNQYIYKLKQEDGDAVASRTVSKQGDPGVDFKANTSIYRFHGALLFVDISGFTVLSQKLKVDELKNQINAYFQKIVDIIYKYDGEIIKFAGDALFIIWQTKVSDTSKHTPLPCLDALVCAFKNISTVHSCA
jgi:class 3 adenylate cyclase